MLAFQLHEAKDELTISKDELTELSSEKRKIKDKAAQWMNIAAKSDEALKFANEEMKALKTKVDIKFPFAVLQGRLDLFRRL